jgi:hypothetical protein
MVPPGPRPPAPKGDALRDGDPIERLGVRFRAEIRQTARGGPSTRLGLLGCGEGVTVRRGEL